MNVKATLLVFGVLMTLLAFGGSSLWSQESPESTEPWTLDCSDSSAIFSARYFPKSNEMEITFHSNREIHYRYVKVPEALWRAWVAAPSKGRFFHTRIAEKPFARESALAGS